MWQPLALIICSIPFFGWSTQLLPWFGTDYEVESRTTVFFQTYKNIDRKGDAVRDPSDGCFFHQSFSGAFGRDEDKAAEIEFIAAETRAHRFALDSIRLTGRYPIYDDILGDPFSVIVGVTLAQTGALGLNDISSFHHGRFAGELHVSLGRETACGANWKSRWWTVALLGMADEGCPWGRLMLNYEYRLFENHEFAIFADLLKGFGNKSLNPHHFHGYGDIDHRSIDLGCRYTYLINFFGSVSFEYVNRVYGYNFPLHAQVFKLSVFYPFGL